MYNKLLSTGWNYGRKYCTYVRNINVYCFRLDYNYTICINVDKNACSLIH